MRENEGVAARILLNFDVDPGRVRQEDYFECSQVPGGEFEPEASAEPNPDVQWTDYGPARPPPPGTSTLALLIAAIVGASIFGTGFLIGWLTWG